MAWDLDICGDEAISMPASETCDECAEFAERLDQLEDRVDAEPNYVPGDNISFEVQQDGTTKISAAGGTGGDYTAGPGIKISPMNEISADVRRPMISDAETSPATDPHAVGEYIITDNKLYSVTAAIAVGDSLVEDTNIAETSVGFELAAINEGLTYKYAGEAFGGVDVALPNNWNVLFIIARYGNSQGIHSQCAAFNVPRVSFQGVLTSGGGDLIAQIETTQYSAVRLHYFGVGGSDYTATSKIYVYYR